MGGVEERELDGKVTTVFMYEILKKKKKVKH